MRSAYLASPYGFSESSRLFMNQVYIPVLRQVVTVINPWDLTSPAEIEAATQEGRSDEFRHEIGKRNAEAIKRADMVIAALDGQELDSGTVAEIGYAAGLGKIVYGYRSDFRQAGEMKAPFNLQVEYFIHASGGKIVDTVDELVETVRQTPEPEQVAQPITESSQSAEPHLKSVANFLYEAGILAKTPRSFTFLLGSGQQSVAEHINRTSYIGMVLALMNGRASVGKVIEMTLLHDLAESRTSDLNYVYQKYVESDESKVIDELASSLPFGDRILGVLGEYKERQSIEAQLAKDADRIEFIMSLREQIDTGNTRADTWMPSALKRLKTDEGIRLAKAVIETPSDDWWYGNKDDEWWVNRSGMNMEKRF